MSFVRIIMGTDGDECIRVRTTVLAAASPVFEHMFGDVHHACDDTIVMTDTTCSAFETFVRLAGITSYDADCANAIHGVDDQELLSSVCDDTIRLIHKYEAYGILSYLKTLLCRCPVPSRVIAIVRFFDEDIGWITPNVMNAVLVDVMRDDGRRLHGVPQVLLIALLVHCFDRLPDPSPLMNVFRPAIDMS